MCEERKMRIIQNHMFVFNAASLIILKNMVFAHDGLLPTNTERKKNCVYLNNTKKSGACLSADFFISLF